MKRKIKLRDLTQKENVKWREKNCVFYGNDWNCNKCIFYNVMCAAYKQKDWINHKDLYSDKFLDQEIEIEAPDILNEKEKKYLKAVIRPFRNRVVSVKKVECSNNSYFINIKIISELSPSRKENIFLPYFQNEMYKGMELNKEYTLEELGL